SQAEDIDRTVWKPVNLAKLTLVGVRDLDRHRAQLVDRLREHPGVLRLVEALLRERHAQVIVVGMQGKFAEQHRAGKLRSSIEAQDVEFFRGHGQAPPRPESRSAVAPGAS